MFLREYELIIGSPATTYGVTAYVDISAIVAPTAPNNPLLVDKIPTQVRYTDYRTTPSGDVVSIINELHIEAEVNYSSRNKNIKGQAATISVYNLSRKTRDTIQKDGIVFLKAGYQDEDGYRGIDREGTIDEERVKASDTPLIFCGQIEKVTTTKSGPDVVTEILCKDLGFSSRNLRVSKTYPRLTSTKSVIQDLLSLAAKAGIPTGHFIEPEYSPTVVGPAMPGTINAALISGLTLEGNLLDTISELCQTVGMQAYIAAGQLFVEPKGPVSRVEVVSLALHHIKSIQNEEDTSGETVSSQGQVNGVKIVTFLNGNIAINKMIRIESGEWQGFYKVVEVRHALSYEGGSWDTEIVATRV